VDTSPSKRELRAETMRRLGMDVDCAADISEARSWWRADLYNLVLINMENEQGHRDKFCDDVRSATPPQQLAFLVGKPKYLADSPNTNAALSIQSNDVQAPQDEMRTAPTADVSGGPPLRWGILEASRRISEVRSAFAARSVAMRNRPSPPRDVEARYSKPAPAESQILPELQKEEMQ
jgi:CheY-like chemotaxis protein